MLLIGNFFAINCCSATVGDRDTWARLVDVGKFLIRKVENEHWDSNHRVVGSG